MGYSKIKAWLSHTESFPYSTVITWLVDIAECTTGVHSRKIRRVHRTNRMTYLLR